MKKRMIVFLAGILLLLGSVYIFIPNVVKLTGNVGIKVTRAGINRMLLDKKNVAAWWPGKMSNDSFYLNDFAYRISNSNISILPVTITGQSKVISSSLLLIEITKDSTQLKWVSAMVTSYNPVKRFFAFIEAKKINSDMNTILKRMESFYTNPENIYGFNIQKELVTDSTLIQTSGRCKGYPTNQFIYGIVDKLSNYAIANTAKITGYPMLNIGTIDSIDFDVKVAMPIDKNLPNSGDILQKRMLGRGNILVVEVKGGIETTNKAYQQIKYYADDYQRVPPAIPFYSLITNRLKEPDSSKWITKIYFPVM
jgi:effector-binding domain-containing protein